MPAILDISSVEEPRQSDLRCAKLKKSIAMLDVKSRIMYLSSFKRLPDMAIFSPNIVLSFFHAKAIFSPQGDICVHVIG